MNEGFFGFSSKKNNKEKFNIIYKSFLKIKNKKNSSLIDRPSVSIKDNYFWISLNDMSLSFTLSRLEIDDLRNFDSADKEVTKITKVEYDEYLSKCLEISDWLDEMSDKEDNKSNSYISDDGDLKFDIDEGEIALEELSSEIGKVFIGKSFEFEVSYHSWDSENSNKKVVERIELPINDIKISFDNRFHIQCSSIGSFGEKTKISIESSSSYEYYDLDIEGFPDMKKVIRMDVNDKENMSRKELRDYDRKFPHTNSYEITPCKYESIEMIKSITEILTQLNDQVKDS